MTEEPTHLARDGAAANVSQQPMRHLLKLFVFYMCPADCLNVPGGCGDRSVSYEWTGLRPFDWPC